MQQAPDQDHGQDTPAKVTMTNGRLSQIFSLDDGLQSGGFWPTTMKNELEFDVADEALNLAMNMKCLVPHNSAILQL